MNKLRVVSDRLRGYARQVLPRSVLRRRNPLSTPVPGRVTFGDLRRTRPIDPYFGWQRGQPIDRYYIERFLASHGSDVRGRVLEVGDATYTRRFGEDRVTRSDVLHVDPDAPQATIVADLADAAHIPADNFDCIILTQTLHLIFDVRAAVATFTGFCTRRRRAGDRARHQPGRPRGVVGFLVLELYRTSGPTNVRDTVCG